MSTFSNYYEACCKVESILPDMDVDTLIDTDDVEAAFEESTMEAAARCVYETTVNFNRMMEACAIEEFACLESTGTEMIYEGAKLDAFFEKAKAFFKSIWQKIQSIYKKAVMQFNSWFKSDKDFIKKYEKELNKALNTRLGADKEVTAFEYDFYSNSEYLKEATKNDKENPTIEGCIKDCLDKTCPSEKDANGWKELAKELSNSDKFNELKEDYIKGFDIGDGVDNVPDLLKELKIKLRGGEEKASKIPLKDIVNDARRFLTESSKIKKSLNDGLKTFKKSIDSNIRFLEGYKKRLNKDVSGDGDDAKIAGDKHSVASNIIRLLQFHRTTHVSIHSTTLSELKSCSRQSKAIIVAAINATKGKDEELATAATATTKTQGGKSKSSDKILPDVDFDFKIDIPDERQAELEESGLLGAVRFI